MRVGIVGTGAIAAKHAQAYRTIGFNLVACTNRTAASGEMFAAQHGCEFVATVEELCSRPDIDYVDVCTLPNFRLPIAGLCAQHGKHLLVEKPMAIDLDTARRMIELAQGAKIQIGVISQRRFDVATLFLKRALADGRLGRMLQADAYVKWHRSAAYYSRPVKGSWAAEGGGALINQGIHQVDLLLHLVGPATRVFGDWQLGALHSIESEDLLVAMYRFKGGARGVIEASTAMWPGYPERIELHGTRGTAIVTGDKLTTWDVQDDTGEPAPLASPSASGASDPMAISLVPLERQLMDFGDACRTGRTPQCSGEDGYRALQMVLCTYESCRTGLPVEIPGS